MSRVAFSGSRSLPPAWAGLVGRVVAGFAGASLAVGCCRGADALVRSAAPGARVFAAASPRPAALVARSVGLVRWLLAGGGPGSLLVVFPAGPCPAGVVPSPRWAGGGSGSWSSAALALGLGVPVVVFWCSPSPLALPPWGPWVAGSGPLAGGWVLRPVQQSLFG